MTNLLDFKWNPTDQGDNIIYIIWVFLKIYFLSTFFQQKVTFILTLFWHIIEFSLFHFSCKVQVNLNPEVAHQKTHKEFSRFHDRASANMLWVHHIILSTVYVNLRPCLKCRRSSPSDHELNNITPAWTAPVTRAKRHRSPRLVTWRLASDLIGRKLYLVAAFERTVNVREVEIIPLCGVSKFQEG